MDFYQEKIIHFLKTSTKYHQQEIQKKHLLFLTLKKLSNTHQRRTRKNEQKICGFSATYVMV